MYKRTLVWMSILVILQEHVYMNSAEKTEATRQGRPLSPRILELQKKRAKEYPVVSKDGVLYYDLAGVEGSKVISRNYQSVQGITATQPGCRLQFLHLDVAYRLDADLFNYCPNISLKLEGKEWLCVREGLLLKEKGIAVNMSLAKCTDTWHDNATQEHKDKYFKYQMREGVEKLMEFGITNCSDERCQCKWYFKNGNYFVNLDCEGVGLTDDTLPILPDRLRDIRLENNNIRSIDKLVKHLLPHNQTLKVLRVNKNHIDALPHFPAGTFPHIINLSLAKNKIEKIDIDAFKDLVTRKNLAIQLEGNIFPCDCDLYKFKIYLASYYMRHWSALRAFVYTKCKSQDENKNQLVYSISKETCHTGTWNFTMDWWSLCIYTLAALNIIMACMVLELVFIVKLKKEKRPAMDCLVGGIQSLLCLSCFRKERNFVTNPQSPLENIFE